MKRVMTVLLSFALLFTALFSYAPMTIHAEEVDENETDIQETLPEEDETVSEEVHIEKEDSDPTETDDEEPEVIVADSLEDAEVDEKDDEINGEMGGLPADAETQAEEENEFTVTQNPDTGDVTITTDNQDLLDYLSNDEDARIYFGSGDSIGRYRGNNETKYYNYYFEVVSNDSGSQYVFIPYEALLSHRIASGDCTVYVSYDDHDYSDEIENLQASSEAPSDVRVMEGEDGLLITSDDLDFLRALVKPTVYDNRDRSGEYGSHVSTDYGNWFGNSRRMGSGWNYLDEYLILDESNKKVIITEDALKTNNFVNGSDRSVDLYAYGYVWLNVGVEGNLTLGCAPLPENHSEDLEIYQDDNGDIVIDSTNKVWLRSLTEIGEYENSGKHIKGGSSISIRHGDYGNNSMWFENRHYIGSNPTIEILYDEDNEVIRIPFEIVLKKGGSLGKDYNSFWFTSYYYENFNIYESEDITLVLTKANKDVPTDIEVYEADNGDIIVESEDTEWMQQLSEFVKNDNGNYGVWINTNNNGWLISNSIYNDGGRSDQEIFYENGHVVIPNDVLIRSSIPNGTHRVHIRAKGYTDSEYYNVEFRHLCKEAPTGITVEENSDGDLVITCADSEWLDALMMRPDDSGWRSYVVIYDEERNWIDNFTSQYNGTSFIRGEDGHTVIIPNQFIQNLHLANKKYYFAFYVYGYERTSTDYLVEITKGCLSAPEDVIITCTLDKIVISSGDTAWLNALAKKRAYYDFSDGTYYSEDGGQIWGELVSDDDYYSFSLDNYVNYYNGEKNYERTEYEVRNGAITISKDKLFTYRIKSGTYRLTLNAYGYEQIVQNVDITTSLKTELPDDINIRFENGSILITSSDSAWLNAVMKAAPSNGNSNDGGFIRLRRYVDGNWYNTYSFYNYENNTNQGYSRTGNTIKISKDTIVNNRRMPSGEYKPEICAYGYVNYLYDGFIQIEGVKAAPNDVSFRQLEDGSLAIESADKDYLKAFAEKYEYDSNWKALSYGSSIELYNYYAVIGDESTHNNNIRAYLSNEKNKNGTWIYITYDESKGYAVVKSDDLRSRGLKTGYYSLYLCAAGYENKEYYNINFSLHLITGISSNVIAGTKEQLEIARPGETVEWSSSNENVATVREDGMFVAKAVGKTEITARVFENGTLVASDKMAVSVIPNSGLTTSIVSDIGTNVMVGKIATLTLSANVEIDQSDVVYTSLDPSKAVVEGNKVMFIGAGKVTVESLFAEKKSTIVFTVYSVEQGLKVTAELSNYENAYLETGDQAVLTLKTSSGDIDPAYITFKSSNEKIVSVDQNGNVTAGAAGSATITATVTNDPSGRKATFAVKVVNRVAESLSVDVDDNEAVVKKNENGIYIDYALLSNTEKIRIVPNAKDKNDFEFVPGQMVYASTDTTVATVDATGLVTFKKDGQVTITCTVKSNPSTKPVSAEIVLRAMNYAPKIESAKITYNKWYADDTLINVYPVYESEISTVAISNDDGMFDVTLVDGNKVKIGLLKADAAAKAYNEVLSFTVNGKPTKYEYKVTVTVTTALPAVTVKTLGSFNTFTTENDLSVDAAAKNADIRNIEFVDGWADYNSETGEVALKQENGKFVTSGMVRFRFEGYKDGGYVEKKVTFKTTATKPTIKLEATAATLFVPDLNQTPYKNVTIRLIDGKKNPITEGVLSVSGLGSSVVSPLDENGYAVIKVADLVNGTVVVSYKGDDCWTGTIDNKLTVKINSTRPTAKLAAGTINYNLKYQTSASVDITSSSASEQISKVLLSENASMPDGIESIGFESGKVVIKAKETGSYKLVLSPFIESDGIEYILNDVILNVKVTEADPKVSLTAATLKLNQLYNEVLETAFKVPANLGFEANVTDIKVDALTEAIADIGYDAESGKISARLNDHAKEVKVGSYAFNIYPEFNGKQSDSPVKLTISLYNKAATATISLKGNLNQLDKDSEVIATLKLANIIDEIESVSLTGDSNLTAELDENGQLIIRLAEDVENLTDGTLTPTIVIATKTGASVNKQVSVKVARKAPTVKLDPSTVNVYDTTGINAVVGSSEFVITGANGRIKTVDISESLAYKVEYQEDKLVVTLIDGAKLKSGSTHNFTIKIDWEGDYLAGSKGAKTTTVKLAVKDASNAVKLK